MEDDVKEKIKTLLVDATEKRDWGSMVNDIERYQKIKELVISAFEVVGVLCPKQVRITVEDKVKILKDQEMFFEFEELEGFLKLVQIFATSLLSSLDEKELKDLATPHKALGHLDALVRINENKKYSEKNVGALGAAMSIELESLKVRLEKMDWKEGWEK